MTIKYTLPRKSFELLVGVLGPEKTGPFVEALESSIDDIINTKYEIKSNSQKEEVKSEITEQLVTKIEFKEEIFLLKQEINQLKIFMIIVILLGLTSNPIISNLILNFIK